MLTQQDAENASGKATRREWIGLAVLALPCILYAKDLTVLNLAIPSLTTPIELLEFTDPNHPGRRQQSKMLI
jgi:DHA2 family multidrug resistance protein-like MFS transporter